VPEDVRFHGYNAPNSISAGAPPQTTLGELTALPQTPYNCILGGLLLRGGKGKRRGEKKREKEKKEGSKEEG